MGQRVIAAASGRGIGAVIDVVFDEACGRVTGFRVKTPRRFRAARIIAFEQVRAFRADTIVVDASAPVRAAGVTRGRRATHGGIRGKAVIDADGRVFGVVSDVVFDEGSGRILAYELLGRDQAAPAAVLELRGPVVIGDVVVVGACTHRTGMSCPRPAGATAH